MKISQSQFNYPTLIGLSAVLMWSVTVGIFRSASEIFGPVASAAMIFTVAGLFACLFIEMPKLKVFHKLYLWIGGGLFVLYEFALALSIGFATDRSQALELGMINYLWPSLTILFAIMVGQQRGHWLMLPSMVLCLLGIVWVMTGNDAWSFNNLWQNIQTNPVGYGMALIAAITWAVYSVFTRQFGKGVNGVPLFLVATAAVLWVKYAVSDEPAIVLNMAGVLQVCVMGVLMATAYSCWNHGIQHGDIAILATMSYFTPVLSMLLATVWLKVMPDAGFMYGVALVTLGSMLSGWATRAKKTHALNT